MVRCESFWKLLEEKDLVYFTGVPDSTFKQWMCFLDANHDKVLTNRVVSIERDAIGWAAGYHVATGKVPVIYMQNSGLGNIINPLTSLTDSEVYKIPLLLMIGWRGEPGKKDEPQHVKMGKITLDLLDCLGIKYLVLEDDIDRIKESLGKALNLITLNHETFALIIKKKLFENYPYIKKELNYTITREKAIAMLASLIGDNIIVSTTGKASRELFELRMKNNLGHHRDFLMVGSMGLASSFAAEIAMQKPLRKVFVIDGDGAALMSSTSFLTIGHYSPKNLVHVIIDNESYCSTGGQPTNSQSVNFQQLALANGYKNVEKVTEIEQIKFYFDKLVNLEGPNALIIKARPGARKDLGRPTNSPVENKTLFMKYLG